MSDLVPQQPDEHIRSVILLNRAHHVQGARRRQQSSFQNRTSKVRYRLFSTPQWPRTMASSASASTGRLEVETRAWPNLMPLIPRGVSGTCHMGIRNAGEHPNEA